MDASLQSKTEEVARQEYTELTRGQKLRRFLLGAVIGTVFSFVLNVAWTVLIYEGIYGDSITCSWSVTLFLDVLIPIALVRQLGRGAPHRLMTYLGLFFGFISGIIATWMLVVLISIWSAHGLWLVP